MYLQCSKKLSSFLQIKKSKFRKLEEFEGDDFINWYGSIYDNNGSIDLLFINCKTLFPLFITNLHFQDFATMEVFEGVIANKVFNSLIFVEMQESDIEKILSTLYDIVFYDSANRKLNNYVNQLYNSYVSLLRLYDSHEQVYKVLVKNPLKELDGISAGDAMESMLENIEISDDFDSDEVTNEDFEQLTDLEAPFDIKRLILGDDYLPNELDELNKSILPELKKIPNYGYIDKDTELYYSRTVLFSNISFLVRLTEDEVQKKELIIGHRLIPFVKHYDKPEALTLYYKSQKLEISSAEFSLHSVSDYFSAMSIFTAMPLMTEDGIMVFSADLTPLFKDREISTQDRILFDPINYKNMVTAAYAEMYKSGEIHNVPYVPPVTVDIFARFNDDDGNIFMNRAAMLMVWEADAPEPEAMNHTFEDMIAGSTNKEGNLEHKTSEDEQDWVSNSDDDEEDEDIRKIKKLYRKYYGTIDTLFSDYDVIFSLVIAEIYVLNEIMNNKRYSFKNVWKHLFSTFHQLEDDTIKNIIDDKLKDFSDLLSKKNKHSQAIITDIKKHEINEHLKNIVTSVAEMSVILSGKNQSGDLTKSEYNKMKRDYNRAVSELKRISEMFTLS